MMRLLLTIAGLSGAALGWAQEVPLIRRFTPKTYGGQNQNWSLAQHPRGWILSGNNSGTLIFDGVRWQCYPLPDGQTVRAVAAAPDGRIFCGGFAEFGYWQRDGGGQMTYHSLSKDVRADWLDREEVWHILVGKHFALFQSFSTLYQYDYRHPPVVLRPPGAIMFAQEVNGRVLLPVIGRGLYELLPDRTFRFVSGSEPLARNIVQFLVPGPAGTIWAGTADNGLFEISNGRCRPWNHPLNATLKKSQPNKAIALSNGGWAIGTILKGVYVLDEQQRLRFHLHRENGLQNNTVLALLNDRDGNLWVGMDRGIDLIVLRHPLVIYTDQGGEIGSVYAAALWQNNLYLGSNQGLFVRHNGRFQLIEGTQGQVWELRLAADQLLCGHNTGTFAVSHHTAIRLSSITGGWCTVAVPQRESLLLQSTYTGLVLYEYTSTGRWRLKHRIEGFQEPLRKIAFDSTGTLWGVHPNRGLYRLRLSEDLHQVLEYRLLKKGDAGLPSDFALDLAEIGGRLIVNTPTGPVSLCNEAVGNSFCFVGPTHSHQRWLRSAGDGYFYTENGYVIWKTPQRAYFLPIRLVPGYERIEHLQSDEYLFCLEDGYARLSLRQLAAYRPRLNAVQVHYVETPARRLSTPHLPLQVPYAENDLRIVYSTPCFERPPRFRWRLEGPCGQGQWSAWSEEAETTLDNLAAGTYILYLEADTGSSPVTLNFRILEPWYQTPAAFVAYALLLMATLLGFEKISQMRLQRQRQRLEMEKQQELAHQRMIAERERFALELANKSRELSNAALSLVRKNEVLLHLREQILKSRHDPNAQQKLVREIDQHLDSEHDWALFEAAFNEVHDDFFKRLLLTYPQLTPGDLRLAAYLKLNLSSKEIAPLLNISVRGVENKRYRLRKKLGLPEEANLTEFILNF